MRKVVVLEKFLDRITAANEDPFVFPLKSCTAAFQTIDQSKLEHWTAPRAAE